MDNGKRIHISQGLSTTVSTVNGSDASAMAKDNNSGLSWAELACLMVRFILGNGLEWRDGKVARFKA